MQNPSKIADKNNIEKQGNTSKITLDNMNKHAKIFSKIADNNNIEEQGNTM